MLLGVVGPIGRLLDQRQVVVSEGVLVVVLDHLPVAILGLLEVARHMGVEALLQGLRGGLGPLGVALVVATGRQWQHTAIANATSPRAAPVPPGAAPWGARYSPSAAPP